MLTRELLTQSLPFLHLTDKVYQALQLMNDNHVTHLPIVEGDKFVGLISEEDLLQAENDHHTLGQLEQSFFNVSVREEDHFLKAVQMAAEAGLSVVPVVNEENDLTGTVAYTDLLRYASDFMSLKEPGGLIVLNSDSFTERNLLKAGYDHDPRHAGELDAYQVGDITKDLANFYQVDRGKIGGRHGSLDAMGEKVR